MSGSALPYRLRPHKAVDRRLFVDLLNRYERWRDLDDHVYVSMAAFAMEDQKLVHRALGLQRLVAFDMNADVVGRQRFNRPTDETKCVTSTSGDMVKGFVRNVAEAGIQDASGYIVWLDYTSPKEIGNQISEFASLLPQLAPDDIVRVTVNASWDWWAGGSPSDKPVPIEKRQAKAMARLRSLLVSYLPSDVKEDTLDEHGICVALARCFGKAAGGVVRGARSFEPLSIIRYADGQQMLTLTGAITENAQRSALRGKLGLNSWPFASSNWSDVNYLAVPDLTSRERLFLEREACRGAQALKDDLGFDLEAAAEMPGFIENFERYYRHYPAFTAVEL